MFYLIRDTDVTGVSGTGVVAQGCLFDNGHAALSWLGERASDVIWTPSYIVDEDGVRMITALDKINSVHGHNGATRIVWAVPAVMSQHAAGLDALLEPDPGITADTAREY